MNETEAVGHALTEAYLDRTRGPVATVLVQNGTLRAVCCDFLAVAAMASLLPAFCLHPIPFDVPSLISLFF